jgi:hypothetical protein
VVPAALGGHAAVAGSFTLLEFAELLPVPTWGESAELIATLATELYADREEP